MAIDENPHRQTTTPENNPAFLTSITQNSTPKHPLKNDSPTDQTKYSNVLVSENNIAAISVITLDHTVSDLSIDTIEGIIRKIWKYNSCN